MLIIRGKGVGLGWDRCFRIAKLLEKIVHRLALRVEDGRPSILKQLRGSLRMRGRLSRLAYRGNR
jgi:hypothetical protein